METNLQEIIEYYKTRGAAREQTALVSLLREAQDLGGGVLRQDDLETIAEALGLKLTYLSAVIKRISDLRTESARHRLTICSGPNCSKRNSELRRHIEETYSVQHGGVSARGSFSYKVGGCMKHCKDGPCITWDGEVYTEMNPRRLDRLVNHK